jgi:hypothetical protein
VKITNAGKKVDKSRYSFYSGNDYIYFKQLVTSPVTIEYVAGYLPEDLPASIKQAIIIHIAAMYQNREFSENVPVFARGLYDQHRIRRII